MNMNDRIAMFIVKRVSTMWCAYFFAILAMIGLANVNSITAMVQWTSQTFIQLVMLSVLAVAGDLLARHSEIRADEHYRNDIHMGEEVRSLHEKIDWLCDYCLRRDIDAGDI
jgi:hypothetical protein